MVSNSAYLAMSSAFQQAPARRRPVRLGLALLAPAVIVLTLVFFAPLINLGAASLRAHEGMGVIGNTVTLGNYAEFFGDIYYWGLLLNTFAIAAGVILVTTAIGYPVAYFLARTRSRWRGTIMFIVVAPLMISAVVRNLGWFPLLGESGFINWLLLTLGIVQQPLRLIYNTTGVIIGLSHALSPFMILSLTTVIQKIPLELEEAALSLGARPFTAFRLVILPLSTTGLLTGGALVFTISLSAFMTTSMLGGGRVQTIATYVAEQFRALLNYPAGATAAIILLVITLAIAIGVGRIEARAS